MAAPEGWNGKYQAVGNGGWAGIISYPAMASALREGYATSSTDTGHVGGTSGPLIGHPEKVIDYSHRAVHEMTVTSKALINAFYDRGPRLWYWNGCSTGGRQGLMSAQRFPEDFDAILAGAPANYHSHLHSNDLVNAVPALNTPGGAAHAGQAADVEPGGAQRLRRDRRRQGRPDHRAARVQVRPGDAGLQSRRRRQLPDAGQVESVKRMYAPSKFSNGTVIFPGKAFGSEASWTAIVSTSTQPIFVATGSFELAYQDPKWDWRKFDADRDVKFVDEKTGFVNAVDPDLSKFKARGGKILMYHGWNEAAISPENSLNYYNSVQAKMGRSQDVVRLFMMPGMGHCAGGQGPDQVNFMGALERWRERGRAGSMIATERPARAWT